MVIQGNVEYDAVQVATPIGFVKVLENVVARMDLNLEEEREIQARKEKRMADIQSEVAHPFDKAEHLLWLRQRQTEIESVLDLAKGEMTAVEEAKALETA